MMVALAGACGDGGSAGGWWASGGVTQPVYLCKLVPAIDTYTCTCFRNQLLQHVFASAGAQYRFAPITSSRVGPPAFALICSAVFRLIL